MKIGDRVSIFRGEVPEGKGRICARSPGKATVETEGLPALAPFYEADERFFTRDPDGGWILRAPVGI